MTGRLIYTFVTQFFFSVFFVLFCVLALSMVASLDGLRSSALPALWQSSLALAYTHRFVGVIDR